ncbi:MAG: DUF1294 domain-containing protein [Alistipes sp.]|nr:DUF1294 domain-containing protein [Alistipes sp.]
MIDLLILFIASIFTYVIFGWDKHLSIYDRSRVPEATLLFFAFIGGAFGALCAMIMFKHKIHKLYFVICVPLFLLLQLLVVILYRAFVL